MIIRKIHIPIYSFAVIMLLCSCVAAQRVGVKRIKLVVDLNGKGNFRSIQEAINSLKDSSVNYRVIHIMPGVYNEKIFITKHNIILEGEDRPAWRLFLARTAPRSRCGCGQRDRRRR